MAKLEWRWALPSGETIEARLEGGVESVYVGPRLASRSPPAGMPAGHAVALGEKQLHVAFDRAKHDCVLTLDGAPIEPAAAPPKVDLAALPAAPPAPAKSVPTGTIAGGAALLVFVVGWLGCVGVHGPGAVVDRVLGSNTPLNSMHTTPDGLVIARYPIDFNPMTGAGGKLTVGRSGVDDEIVFADESLAGERDAQTAGREALDAFTTAMASHGLVIGASETKEGSCYNGLPGVEITAAFTHGAAGGALWSCAFLKWDRAYLLGYVVPDDRQYRDELLLRRVVGGTQLVNPDRSRR